MSFPADWPPRLLTVVHTEEEFDWSRPCSRAATGVTHLQRLAEVSDLLAGRGVVPTYVVDHPVAADAEGAAALRAEVARGRAEIGAHLHPWHSPPFEEAVTPRNTYPCNLPADLERAKLESLTRAIEEAFGARPRVYLAGRYGYGPNTRAALAALGYDIDLSIMPAYDYGADGGPDYLGDVCRPFWEPGAPGLLRIPHTAAFVGPLAGLGPALMNGALAALRPLRVPGALARLGLLERLRLSPEGFSQADMLRLTRWLYRRGVRVFLLSFHSPSIAPGNTPYVVTERDREAFLRALDGYLEVFLGDVGGIPATPREVKALAEAAGEGC